MLIQFCHNCSYHEMHPGVFRMQSTEPNQGDGERVQEKKRDTDFCCRRNEKCVCGFFLLSCHYFIFSVHFIRYNDPYMLKVASNKPLTITYRRLFIFYADCGLNTHFTVYAITVAHICNCATEEKTHTQINNINSSSRIYKCSHFMKWKSNDWL